METLLCGFCADDIKEIEAEIEDIMGVSEHSEVTKMQPVENEQEEKMHVVEYS